MELRDYQANSIAALRHGFKAGHKRQVLMLATGGGKTAISSALMLAATAKRRRAIFIVNRLTLIDQAAEAFRREGLRIGIIQGQHEWTDYAAPIQVASIQTLQRRQNIPHFDFAVIDEVHEFYTAHRDLMKQNPATPFIGLSATPFTPGLGKWFSNLVIGATTAELAEKGWLVPSITYAPAELPDLQGVKIARGDYVEKELAGKMQAPQIMGCVVETWLKHGEDRPTLCFAVNIAHSRSMVHEFQRAGIKAVHIDAYTDGEERKAVFKRFKEGSVKILSSVGVLTTGFDMPNAECVILARPTKSLMLHIQQIGRGLRISPNTGKSCLAAGTKLLTQHGLIEIQKIKSHHLLWDGNIWVRHGGVISKGFRNVITYQGLTATPDHKVWTKEGWRAFGYCAEKQIPIIQTGSGRSAIRISDNCLPKSELGREAVVKKDSCFYTLRRVWRRAVDFASELTARANQGMPLLQSAETVSEVVISTDAAGSTALREPEGNKLAALRGAWNYLRFFFTLRRCALGERKSWYPGQSKVFRDRQNRQQQGIFTGELEVVNEKAKPISYEIKTKYGHDAQVQAETSGDTIRRFDDYPYVIDGNDVRSDRYSISQTIPQTKREVWDILNAGPRNCFTAEGLLVHNCCLILDHAGNTLVHGFAHDPLPDELDAGKERQSSGRNDKSRKVKLPTKCHHCGYVKPPEEYRCSQCGFAPERPSNVEEIDGDLIRVEGKSKQKKLTKADKQRWWSMILRYATRRGFSRGWAAHTYRDRFQVWPRGLKDWEVEPDLDVMRFIKHKQIRYAKSREAKVSSHG